MSSTEVQGRLDSDPTRYANYGGAYDEMYREDPAAYPGMYSEMHYVNTLPPESEFAPGREADPRKWTHTLLLAGLGLVTACVLAFLTLSMVRATDPVEATPSGVVTHSMTAAPSAESRVPAVERNGNRPAVVPTGQPTVVRTGQPTVVPTGQPQPTTVTVTPAPQPSRTTIRPAPPAPATMTNPLEPAPATMTNPLEPAPATMTNPLEPAPATMTNPLEPGPVGSSDAID